MRSTWSIALVWGLVLLLIYFGFTQFIAHQYHPQMQISQSGQQREITLTRAKDGHYRLAAQMNGEPVVLLLDTGATAMTINQALAERIGLVKGEQFIANTANGPVQGYQSVLDSLIFGPFEFKNVPIGVVPNLGDEVLLGMNIIKHFDIRTQNNQMHMKLIEK
ncbi:MULTISPECIES: retropepsin-like aspartic protease family protein [Deefgea]|uniref:TIGR02281 family clan AA aspartic protease n=1 Tax=Deefgea chitinilytica TaxID=570276 RepID=A0ABS2C9Q5_9NEIS|nr:MULTISPECIES: retropepsin-like aspartic protease [Deefgea]MBM5570772.1 TIGR02281 family clan AA aspartic protease [Deefgea chitinilytica]MBM9888001.1 retroviral-like aspartic protease family protein [Deefgea sp. CFH1-16]